MAEAPPQAPPRHGASAPHAGDALTRKLGPLPVWAWALVVVGAYLLYKHYQGTSAGAAAAASPAATSNPLPAGDMSGGGQGSGGAGTTPPNAVPGGANPGGPSAPTSGPSAPTSTGPVVVTDTPSGSTLAATTPTRTTYTYSAPVTPVSVGAVIPAGMVTPSGQIQTTASPSGNQPGGSEVVLRGSR